MSSKRSEEKADRLVAGDRRSPSRGELQRRAILDSLPRVLRQRPIGEVTIGEIATEAGVLRSGFYFYFESKYAALAVATSDIWSELMDRAHTFTRPDTESVEDYLRRTAGLALEMWHSHDAVLIASVQAIPLDEQIATMWSGWTERLAGILSQQVRKDQSDGLAHPVSDDVEGLISILLEMTMHMFYQDRLLRNDEQATKRMLNTVQAIWLSSAWGAGRVAPQAEVLGTP